MQTKKKTSFMANVVMLMLSQILIKVLGLVYRLVITNLEGFGNIGNGYYAAGYQIYALLLTVSSIGIPNAISKLVAEKVALGDNKGAHRIFKVSLILFGTIGGALSIGLAVRSKLYKHLLFKSTRCKLYTYSSFTSNCFSITLCCG